MIIRPAVATSLHSFWICLPALETTDEPHADAEFAHLLLIVLLTGWSWVWLPKKTGNFDFTRHGARGKALKNKE